MTNIKNNYYESSDLALSATISLWYPVEGIDRSDSHKAVFFFKHDSGLDQLLESYWRGELKVEPQAYFNAIKAIKSRLYNQ